jgi:hypothetical protein
LHLACRLDFDIHPISLLIENPQDDEALFDDAMDAEPEDMGMEPSPDGCEALDFPHTNEYQSSPVLGTSLGGFAAKRVT